MINKYDIMILSDPSRLISFLFDHLEFSINIISQYYPFTKGELRKYFDKLDWFWVSMNEAIVWSEKLYNEFYDQISLPSLANNKTFPWTEGSPNERRMGNTNKTRL
jgi:hypothetical protein